MDRYRIYISGLFLCTATAILSMIASSKLSNIGSATISIISGILITNLFVLPQKVQPGVRFCEKKLLETAVVLMGLQLHLQHLLQSGRLAIFTISVSILSAFAAAWLIRNIKKKYLVETIFLGVGTAICGSSAIAAVTPLFPKHRESAAFGIGVINLLGIIGLLGLPILTSYFQFSADETAALIGGSLQSVGHVAATAMPLGEDIYQLAIPIKMGRVAMLVPVLFILNYRLRNVDKETSKQPIKLPWYLYGFIITAVLGMLDFLPKDLHNKLNITGNLLLNIAMVAIGIQLKISLLKDKMSGTMMVAAAVWLFQIFALCILFLLL